MLCPFEGTHDVVTQNARAGCCRRSNGRHDTGNSSTVLLTSSAHFHVRLGARPHTDGSVFSKRARGGQLPLPRPPQCSPQVPPSFRLTHLIFPRQKHPRRLRPHRCKRESRVDVPRPTHATPGRQANAVGERAVSQELLTRSCPTCSYRARRRCHRSPPPPPPPSPPPLRRGPRPWPRPWPRPPSL